MILSLLFVFRYDNGNPEISHRTEFSKQITKLFVLVKNNTLFRIYIGKLVGSVRVFIRILFPSNIGVSTATRARASCSSWSSGYCCPEFVCVRVFQVEKPVENIVSYFPSRF